MHHSNAVAIALADASEDASNSHALRKSRLGRNWLILNRVVREPQLAAAGATDPWARYDIRSTSTHLWSLSSTPPEYIFLALRGRAEELGGGAALKG